MTQSFTSDGSGGFNFSIFAPPPPADALYRSEQSPDKGIGYPSCSRALARIPPNHNDANGYYELLGVKPWSPIAEIKSAIRRLLAKYHPDGAEPDLKMFMRIKEIASCLLNPIHKANYDSIPQGRKLIDSEVQAQMAEAGIEPEDPGIQQFARSPEDMGMKPDDPNAKPKQRELYWDYLATDHADLDLINAQEWYAYLLELTPIFRYDATIKVLMHDGKSSAFKKQGGIMLIPRVWEPSAALAFHMLVRHLGWPDATKPRYPIAEAVEPVFTVSYGSWSGTGINGGGGLLAVNHTDVTDSV
jgi:curved DNA-binding protein CbpA